MPKTVTLRLSDETYQKFLSAAKAEKRPLSNLIEVLALKKLEEDLFVDAIEMEEILSNEELMTRLERGTREESSFSRTSFKKKIKAFNAWFCVEEATFLSTAR